MIYSTDSFELHSPLYVSAIKVHISQNKFLQRRCQTLQQRSRFVPTHTAKNKLKENTEFSCDLAGFHIRQLPPGPFRENEPSHCVPQTSGNELNGTYWNVFLPLKMVSSIDHRDITIERHDHNNRTQSIRTFGTVNFHQENRRYQTQMITAQVLFRYPIVGCILFRQPRDDSSLETTIIVEY